MIEAEDGFSRNRFEIRAGNSLWQAPRKRIATPDSNDPGSQAERPTPAAAMGDLPGWDNEPTEVEITRIEHQFCHPEAPR